MLSWVEHENIFITSGPGTLIQRQLRTSIRSGVGFPISSTDQHRKSYTLIFQPYNEIIQEMQQLQSKTFQRHYYKNKASMLGNNPSFAFQDHKIYIYNSMRFNMRKRTVWNVNPTNTKISRIRSIWPESSLFIRRNHISLAIQNVPSEDSDQTARVCKLIWIFAWRTCLEVHFLTLRLVSFSCLLYKNHILAL